LIFSHSVRTTEICRLRSVDSDEPAGVEQPGDKMPKPSARQRIAAMAKAGFLASERAAKRMSWNTGHSGAGDTDWMGGRTVIEDGGEAGKK
jgi:hypothetical protein